MKLRHTVIGFRLIETTYFPYLQEQIYLLDLEDDVVLCHEFPGRIAQ